jgi:hypothetical protein
MYRATNALASALPKCIAQCRLTRLSKGRVMCRLPVILVKLESLGHEQSQKDEITTVKNTQHFFIPKLIC